MPTDHWRRLERLFAEAMEQPAATRGEFLKRTCGSDARLRQDVVSLLTAVDEAGDFLSAPALDVFARQISREGWTVQPGDRIGAYTVERRLGAGGVGEVWQARDERLERDVAIKLLLPHPSGAAERVRAFQQEARAAGTLNHPNVLTVYDVGDHEGAPYLVMECLDGESLRARFRAGAVPVDVALDIALQVAQGLAAAHARGIVHRDLKPENIFLALDGRAKILDFGLATLHSAPSPAGHPPETHVDTMRPVVAGTAGYMSPEQMRGETVDGRADIFAFGAVLYEMLAGIAPFRADTMLGTLDAVLTREPPDLAGVNPDVSPALSLIVRRCLWKSADERFPAMTDVISALDSVIRARHTPATPRRRMLVRRPGVVATMLVGVLTVAAGGWRWYVVTRQAQWARTVAAPEIQRFASHGDYAAAYLLARQALDAVPDDPQLRQLWLDVSIPVVVTTDPPGADVAFAAYSSPVKNWFSLGRTPLNGVRVPRRLVRLRVSKAGFLPIEGSESPPGVRYRLDPVDAAPPGMVRIVGGSDPARAGLSAQLDDYWIDRFEVTNKQFKGFVDHGGYAARQYWQQPFVENGRIVSWEDALRRFRDRTGRPGPATWAFGSYPEGQGDFPVGGVSWYEAAAYAAFVGKDLPTIYHWYRAAGLGRFADILTVSNFSGKGPAPVGSYEGVGPFGTYDMAGNVKEWCWTETNNNRFLLGGAWDEPRYMYADYDARGPFERAPEYGFRLAKYGAALPPAVVAPVRIESLGRDARRERPVSDVIFEVYRRQFTYDRTPLNAVVEATEDTDIAVRHTVLLDLAYGGERMHAYLFLPKHGSPPYQTIVFFPGGDAFQLRSSRDISLSVGDFIVRSGRAFLYPVYKGTYERGPFGETGTNAERDLYIAWSRDLGRAIDYLETRADIDRSRLAFYGLSAGADAGVILTALESRFKASVLQGTGLWDTASPEIDAINYAPRIRVPTLMLNGRYDFGIPFETAQRPLFDLLGTRATDKRHTVLETGHALPSDDVSRVILPWLDRYLGQVVASSSFSRSGASVPESRR